MSGPIICGVDDSESAKEAARIARDVSALLGRRLVFVRVLERGSPERMNTVAARLQDLTENADGFDGGADWVVEVGHPADRLVAVAKREEASLIVVGSTGPRSSLLGSVSADVSRRAPCPVVIVPPSAEGVVLAGAFHPVEQRSLREYPKRNAEHLRGDLAPDPPLDLRRLWRPVKRA
jgi:nucleotide-binding universal stress UspA family protein